MSFDIHFLGTSAAIPYKERKPSAQYIQVNKQRLLIDCGEGTQQQLNKYQINAHKIEHILISHLHGDHIFGLPGLLSSLHLFKRTKPLHLYAPLGLKEMLRSIFRYSETTLSFPLQFHALQAEGQRLLFENDELEVSSFPLEHRIACWGFLIKEKPKLRNLLPEKLPRGLPFPLLKALKAGEDVRYENELVRFEEVTLPPKKSRSYAYCSDTRYLEDIVPYIQKVDVLYHESTFLEKHLARARKTYHSTARQAAGIAFRAQVQQLYLGHFSSRYKSLDVFLEEAQEVFLETKLAKEGDIVSISEDY
ncbi:ribonuclease Z [Rapidithrix thailandica]|uniref:Ribonuclease Z n=1 Tax=Rapidithrix thailandica TaxID=413964 RepID=A0AAW9SGJ8_9BACT